MFYRNSIFYVASTSRISHCALDSLVQQAARSISEEEVLELEAVKDEGSQAAQGQHVRNTEIRSLHAIILRVIIYGRSEG